MLTAAKRAMATLFVMVGLSATATPPAGAEAMTVLSKPVGVVELFTSQGCSSCPPADAVLGKLVAEGEVVALAYHVDYWNYIGWEDTFGTPENTERQYAYAKSLGRHGVYTPQAIVNGREHLNGADIKGIKGKLATFEKNGKGLTVPIEVEDLGDTVRINVGPGTGEAKLLAVYFDGRSKVKIESGENRGKTITYWHSVTDFQVVDMWHGAPLKLELPKSAVRTDQNGCAFLLQKAIKGDKPGPIIGAAMVMPEAPRESGIAAR